MYGAKLRAVIWAGIALLSTAFLTFFGNEPSWSENALKAFNSILNIALIGIADVFSHIATLKENEEKVYYKPFGIDIRLDHLARFTKYSFFGIAVCSLNSIVPEILHMIATGLSVTGLFLQMIKYKEWNKGGWFFVLIISMAALSLILAFGFGLAEVKYAEFSLIVVGMYYLYDVIFEN